MPTLRVADGQVLRPDLTVEHADLLVDTKAGTILEVGPTGGGDEVLDAEGGLVIPGLVNAHTHVAMTLLRGYADDKPLDRWLQEDIWPVEAQLTPADVRAGADLGLLEMIRSGTTAFADMYFHEPSVAEAVDQAGLRARLGHGIITVGKDEASARKDFAQGLEFATEFDDSAGGRIRTALMPHSLTTVDEQYLSEFLPRAGEADVPIHYHANETVDEVEPIIDDHGSQPLAYADTLGMLEVGDFLAHAVHLADSEIELLAERDAAVVHCPASNMKLASGMAPVQTLLDRGVDVALGTDGAASNNDLDMFDEMRDAAMVGKLAATDASALDAPTVVRMATEAGANALGFDGGHLEAGAPADFAVLDLDAPHLTPAHDLVSHLVYAARGSDVRHTVCDGQVLMRDRTVIPLDAGVVKATAADRARALVDRAVN